MGLEAHFQLLMGLSGPGGLTGEWAEGGFHPARPHPDLEDGVQHTHLDGVFLAHTANGTAAPWLRAGGWSGFPALPS